MIANAGDREAMTAAEEWLALVDAGEYNQSWLTANKTLKEQSEKDDWAAIRGGKTSFSILRVFESWWLDFYEIFSNRAAARSTIHSNLPGSGRINWAGKRSG